MYYPICHFHYMQLFYAAGNLFYKSSEAEK